MQKTLDRSPLAGVGPCRPSVYPTQPSAAVARSARVSARVRSLPLLALALAASLAGPGCVTNPVTGRSSLNYFTSAQDVQLGNEAYAEIKADPRVLSYGPQKAMVERCVQRLVAAIPPEQDPGYAWEVVVIDDDATVNAFALPGGKMAVYTGILPICQDETGLAVVMGHEIGHVTARHGTSRVSSQMTVSAPAALISAWLGGDPEATNYLLGIVADLGLKAYGRGDESDADHTGLIYMARAGYDPREATRFWGRMAQLGGAAVPEFLSTHPSHETRVERLTALMDEALAIYQGGSSAP